MTLKQVKSLIYFLIAGIFLLPNLSLAAGVQCSPNGYTVATINGVFTDDNGAVKNRDALEYKLGKEYKSEAVDVEYLPNPPHLGGLGDILKSVLQGIFDDETVQDYDLVEMLKSASEKVKTQKLLLVAHSQGNFYANSFYDTVAGKQGGVPTESIGVYSVATPSGRVAGDGGWITSDTDRVIAGVLGRTLRRSIMKPNTHIVLQPDDDSLGHNFSSVYLKYRSAEIVAGIGSSLDRLQVNSDALGRSPDSEGRRESPCLAPPKLTLGHKIEGALFAVADPVADAGNAAVTGIATGMYNTGRSALAAVGADISRVLNPRTLFSVAGALYGTSVAQKDLQDDVPQQNSNQNPPPPPVQPQQTPRLSPLRQTSPDPIAQTQTPTPTKIVPVPASRRVAFVAGSLQENSGGGGSGGIGIVEGNMPAPVPASTPPTPSGVGAPTGSVGAATTSTATSTGSIASTSSQPSQNATAGTAPQATTTSTATTASSNSATSSVSSAQDTTPPDISFTVATCAASLSLSGCLIASTTLVMNWSSAASDFDHYMVSCTANGAACANFPPSPAATAGQGNFASTTATSTIFAAVDNMTYVFSASAVDHVGNASAAITKTVSVATRPVVINEIAWAGTSSNRSEDEWIELYNTTDSDISLANWVLRSATDNTPYIKLSGTIAARAYYLIERTDDSVISDVAANLTSSFGAGGLNNNGEVLELSYASASTSSPQATTTIDKTPAVCGSVWCYGSAGSQYLTMERYDPYASGDNQFNWGSWIGFGASSKNAENAAVRGTPGRRNSLNYLINKSAPYMIVDTTLKKSGSPYVLMPTNFTVGTGSTLDVESGVVIKFFGGGTLTVNGVLRTHGTAADPVVFTSINDDEYGGDVNNDGSTTPAKAGDWSTIQPTSNGSIFDYAIIRYGGRIDPFYGSVQAQLQALNVAVTITNSVSELSGTGGFWFGNVSGEVSSSIIRDNRAASGNIGMRINAGSLAVRNNLFQRNSVGLFVGGSSSQTVTVSGNTFSDQTGDPVDYYGGHVLFSGNHASGNKLDGIVVKGAVLDGGTFGPDLPYIMDNDVNKTVSSGTNLTVLPGTIFKFMNAPAMYVDGMLDAQGTADAPIVFTSVHDDDCGLSGSPPSPSATAGQGCGDTDRATTSPSAGDWGGVIFRANGGATSTLDHVVVRYGGNKNVNIGDHGAVGVQNGTAPVRISNSTIEKSYFAGVFISGTASTTISHTRFSNNSQNIATSFGASWIDGGGNVME